MIRRKPFKQSNLIKKTGSQHPRGICLGLVVQWLISIRSNMAGDDQFWQDIENSLATNENSPLLGVGYARKAIEFQAQYAESFTDALMSGMYASGQLKAAGLKLENAIGETPFEGGASIGRITEKLLNNKNRYCLLLIKGEFGNHAIGVHRNYALIGKSTDVQIFDPNLGKYSCSGSEDILGAIAEILNLYPGKATYQLEFYDTIQKGLLMTSSVNPAKPVGLISMPGADAAVLRKSISQFSHFTKAYATRRNAHLLRTSSGVLTEEAPPPGAPSSTDLTKILNDAVERPGTTSIATVPSPAVPDLERKEMLEMLGQVQTLDSYISLLTAFCIYNEHPEPYDITIPAQASAFTRAMAKWRNYVITGGAVKAMAGYLPVKGGIQNSFSKTVTAANLHLEFLTEVFGGFSFPQSALDQLDSILTNVFSKLKTLTASFETQNSTFDHFLTYYYFSTVEGTGGPNQPPAMYVPKVRIFYFHIDQSTWKATIGKSSISKFKFNMNYYDMDTAMNPGLVSKDMHKINSAIETLTAKSAQEVNKLMNMQAIAANPQGS